MADWQTDVRTICTLSRLKSLSIRRQDKKMLILFDESVTSKAHSETNVSWSYEQTFTP